MSVPPLRVGLIGYGMAGRVFHAPLISTTADLELAAIVTANAERQAAARHDHPTAVVLPTADELWAIARQLDLVVVAAPNRYHGPLAMTALRTGLPVVLDKPMAPTAAEASAVLLEAQRLGLPISVFQNRRWDGDFLTVRALVESGELGHVNRFESRFERWRPEIETGWRESGADGEAGGVLFDLGPHLIDQAVQLFGRVTAIYAELDRRRPRAEVDDDAFVALEHASGTRSHLWMSAAAAQLGPRMRVLGERGGYTKYGLDGQEASLAAGARPGGTGFGEEPREGWGTVGAEGDLRALPTMRGRYDAYYVAVAAAIRDGSPMPVDAADSVSVLALLKIAHASAASGLRVSVPLR